MDAEKGWGKTVILLETTKLVPVERLATIAARTRPLYGRSAFVVAFLGAILREKDCTPLTGND